MKESLSTMGVYSMDIDDTEIPFEQIFKEEERRFKSKTGKRRKRVTTIPFSEYFYIPSSDTTHFHNILIHKMKDYDRNAIYLVNHLN